MGRSRYAPPPSQQPAKGAAHAEFWRRFLDRVHPEQPDWTSGRPVGPNNGLGFALLRSASAMLYGVPAPNRGAEAREALF